VQFALCPLEMDVTRLRQEEIINEIEMIMLSAEVLADNDKLHVKSIF